MKTKYMSRKFIVAVIGLVISLVALVINNNTDNPANTIKIQLSISIEIKPTVAHIKPIIINENIGIIFCFCRLKSVKRRIADITNATKFIILIIF